VPFAVAALKVTVVPAAEDSVTVKVSNFVPLLPSTRLLSPIDSVGEAGGFQPSWITSKSLALSRLKAGLSVSLSQRVSNVPEMYMSLPLSAMIRPYFCIVRKMRRAIGSAVRSTGSWPLTSAFRRRRVPSGGAPAPLPASCEAGNT